MLSKVLAEVQQFLPTLDPDPAHDFDHILEVLVHGQKGYQTSSWHGKLTSDQEEDIWLAIALHEVDDHKLTSSEDYENARRILRKCGWHDIDTVIELIDLVSCSHNGNTPVPELWKLIPRAAERMAAIGIRGMERAFAYGKAKKRPMRVRSTPRFTTAEEIKAGAKYERFQAYVRSGGRSASTIDHVFDKLLHLNNPHLPEIDMSEYFREESIRLHKEMVDYLLNLRF